MFTGIIEETGKLKSYRDQDGKRCLTINCQIVTGDLKIGDSVCCNGACLTVTEFDDSQISVEVMAETLQKTTLKSWKTGELINLERAMPANGRFNGHFVQGHVDTTALILSKDFDGQTVYLWIELPDEYRNLVTCQGSIAIDGVSLTIARLQKNRFAVALISHTLKSTNLQENKKIVNLEFDILGKYLLRYSQNKNKPKITEDWLREKGF